MKGKLPSLKLKFTLPYPQG